MSSTRILLLSSFVCGALLLAFQTEPPPAPGPFLVPPYLQLGNAAVLPAKAEQLTLLWHTADRDGRWSVAVRRNETEAW